jgi:hypothetical protein
VRRSGIRLSIAALRRLEVARNDDPIGGEVRIGSGRAPAFLRWFNYAVYAAAIAYLIAFWPDTGYHPLVIAFAVLLTAWLAYIYFARKPAEP